MFAEHRCAGTFFVRIPGVTTRPRKVIAPSADQACVLLADHLDRTGRLSAGARFVAFVRRVGQETWTQVTIDAVGVTTYHATHVRDLPAC